MEQISALLGKFKNLAAKNEAAVTAVAEILREKFGIKIENSKISVSGKKLSIKISGAGKTEVLTQKKAVMNEINKKLGAETISDISF